MELSEKISKSEMKTKLENLVVSERTIEATRIHHSLTLVEKRLKEIDTIASNFDGYWYVSDYSNTDKSIGIEGLWEKKDEDLERINHITGILLRQNMIDEAEEFAGLYYQKKSLAEEKKNFEEKHGLKIECEQRRFVFEE